MARLKKLTLAQRKQGGKLWNDCEKAYLAIFQGNSLITFNEAYKIAPVELRNAYDGAQWQLRRYERQLASEGRGWITDHGTFAEFGSYSSPWI